MLRKTDALLGFEQWIKNMPRAELGGLLKEYVAESNHCSWDGWDHRNLTGIRLLFEDVIRYYDGDDRKQSFAARTNNTNPVP